MPPRRKSSVPAPARAVLPVFPRTQVQSKTPAPSTPPAPREPPMPQREAPRRPMTRGALGLPEWDNLMPQEKEALITLFSDDPSPADDTPRGRFSWEYEQQKRAERAKMREEALQMIYGYRGRS